MNRRGALFLRFSLYSHMEMKRVLIWIFCFVSPYLIGQVIQLENPSFEGEIQGYDKNFPGWDVCSVTPDIIGKQNEDWGEITPNPVDGKTYLSLVTLTVRNNDFNESIGQKLSESLVPDSIYEMSFYASGTYWLGDQVDSFTNGVLQVHLGFDSCMTDQLLFERKLMDTVFEKYDLEFEPKNSYDFISFTIGYAKNAIQRVLVDQVSPITYDFITSDNRLQFGTDVKVISTPSGRVKLICGATKDYRLELVDQYGKFIESIMIFSGEEKMTSIEIPGIYFYRLYRSDDSFAKSGKLFIH